MTTTDRVPGHIVDTGYLLCFGSVVEGVTHLKSLFGGGLTAPPAVKAELVSLSERRSKTQEVRQAAARFVGRGADLVVEMRLKAVDIVERDEVRRCFADKLRPTRHPCVFPDDLGDDIRDVTDGADAGEAEAIPLALRLQLPLLINERAGTQYARARGVPATESAAESIKRIAGKTPKQKFQLFRDMERAVGDVGASVPGPSWYREPPPRPTPVPLEA